MKKIFVALLFSSSVFAQFPPEVAGQIRLRALRGDLEQALTQYLNYSNEEHEEDYTLLQEMCLGFLQTGARSNDLQTQLMSLFGAGVAQSASLARVLEEGLESKEMSLQLVALNFLNQLENDRANDYLKRALSSSFLLTRLEACFQLANKGEEQVVDHLMALQPKVPSMVHALFPQILVRIDTPASNRFLKQFLADSNLLVRTEAISCVGRAKRDDFLPQIRKLATQKQFTQQEASLFALGEMGDQQSLPLLKELSDSKQSPIRLAALTSRVKLGDSSALPLLIEEALSGNLFAISFLGQEKGEESLRALQTLTQAPERTIQLNATCALLMRKESPPKHLIESFLFSDDKSWGFTKTATPARSHTAWRVTSLVGVKKDNDPLLLSTQEMKQLLLLASLEQDEAFFLSIARKIFDEKISYLIPPLVTMLANHHTHEALSLLKEMSQKAGAPLVRGFCNLALYQLGEEGPYEERLLTWVKGEQKHQLIQLQQKRVEERESAFTLSADETSGFYLAVLEAIAQTQSENGIATLLEVIESGNPINRFALAGLLIRITQ